MNASAMRRRFPAKRLLSVMAAAWLLSAANVAMAAEADSGPSVECMLPGQIHNVGGHPTMGPRRMVHVAPAECRERGGEYTEPQPTVVPAPSAGFVSGGNDEVRCLVPRQLRRLGEKKRYYVAAHVATTTRASCLKQHGRVQAILSRVRPN